MILQKGFGFFSHLRTSFFSKITKTLPISQATFWNKSSSACPLYLPYLLTVYFIFFNKKNDYWNFVEPLSTQSEATTGLYHVLIKTRKKSPCRTISCGNCIGFMQQVFVTGWGLQGDISEKLIAASALSNASTGFHINCMPQWTEKALINHKNKKKNKNNKKSCFHDGWWATWIKTDKSDFNSCLRSGTALSSVSHCMTCSPSNLKLSSSSPPAGGCGKNNLPSLLKEEGFPLTLKTDYVIPYFPLPLSYFLGGGAGGVERRFVLFFHRWAIFTTGYWKGKDRLKQSKENAGRQKTIFSRYGSRFRSVPLKSSSQADSRAPLPAHPWRSRSCWGQGTENRGGGRDTGNRGQGTWDRGRGDRAGRLRGQSGGARRPLLGALLRQRLQHDVTAAAAPPCRPPSATAGGDSRGFSPCSWEVWWFFPLCFLFRYIF